MARAAGGLLLALCTGGTAVAQQPARLAGRVLGDADVPVAGAEVAVRGTFWSTLTDARGRFTLDVQPGRWELRVRRVGYEPGGATVTVVAGAATEPLVVRLRPAAVALRGIVVTGESAPPLGRSITPATVRQVPPLAEPDIFRAIALSPAVSQPNDFTGRIYLAGGASDETGVTLDGFPLQSPFHLFGALGAFNVAMLERADVLLYHLPASRGGRLSGSIDLVTRQPGDQGHTEVTASLLSASATTVRPRLPGGVDLLASGRITYIDKVLRGVMSRSADPETPVPNFYDGVLRIGRAWRGGWRTEALAFATGDRLSPLRRLDESTPDRLLTWGEVLAGARVSGAAGHWRGSARVSLDETTVRRDVSGPGGEEEIHVERDWLSVGVDATHAAERWSASVGGTLEQRIVRQQWRGVGTERFVFTPRTPPSFDGRDAQTAAALFGELAWAPRPRWIATAGLRSTLVAGRPWLAPRLSLGVGIAPALRVEAALDRRYQFDTQLEEPIEGSITPPIFLLDAPRVATSAGLVARWNPDAGGTRRLPSVELQLFDKWYRERAVLPPSDDGAPPDSAAPFPPFLRVPGESVGAAISTTWEPRRGTLVQASYTLQRARERIAGRASPTVYDLPHALTLFGSAPLAGGVTLNVVFQARSGPVQTPVAARTFTGIPGEWLSPRYLAGDRNSFRLPPYRRLDVGLRRRWRPGRAEITGSLQVLNILARTNALEYDWPTILCAAQGRCTRESGITRRGLPILPTVGIEVRW